MTIHLHPYDIVNGCLLSKGTDQVATYLSSCKIMSETVAFNSLVLSFSDDIQALVRAN